MLRDKAKVEELEVTGYSFLGYVELGQRIHAVAGEFNVDWDGEYPVIELATSWIRGVSSPNLIDLEDLRRQILNTDDGTWYNERLANLEEKSWENET
jgi:hypothetical protein